MAYSNHQGGTKSLAAQKEVDLILAGAELHVPALTTIHMTGGLHQLSAPREWSYLEVFQDHCCRRAEYGPPTFQVQQAEQVWLQLQESSKPLQWML